MSSNYISHLYTSFHDPRTFNQVIIQFITLRIGTNAAAGHLTTLRRLPRLAQITFIITFAFIPTLPLAAILYRLCLCLYVSFTQPWPQDTLGYLAYLFSAVLGVNASIENVDEDQISNDDSIGLLEWGFESYQRISNGWTWKTTGRILVLVALLAQPLAAVILWARRLSCPLETMSQDLLGTPFYSLNESISVTAFDTMNSAYAIGGVLTALTSIAISLCNWSWQVMDIKLEGKPWQRSIEPSGIKRSHLDWRYEILFAAGMFLAINHQARSRMYLILTGPNERFKTYDPTGIFSFLSILAPTPFLAVYLAHGDFTALRWRSGKVRLIIYSFTLFTFDLLPLLFANIDFVAFHQCEQADSYCRSPLQHWKDTWSDKMWSFWARLLVMEAKETGVMTTHSGADRAMTSKFWSVLFFLFRIFVGFFHLSTAAAFGCLSVPAAYAPTAPLFFIVWVAFFFVFGVFSNWGNGVNRGD